MLCAPVTSFMKSRKFSHMDVKELCAPEVTPSDAACLQRALKNCRTRSLLSLPLAPPEVLASEPALLSQFDTRSYTQAPLKHDSTRPADMLSRALHALGELYCCAALVCAHTAVTPRAVTALSMNSQEQKQLLCTPQSSLYQLLQHTSCFNQACTSFCSTLHACMHAQQSVWHSLYCRVWSGA
jgi:hypothetical protein